MKIKSKAALLSAKSRSRDNKGNGRRSETRRRFWLRVAAVILVIVFLASECATLLP